MSIFDMDDNIGAPELYTKADLDATRAEALREAASKVHCVLCDTGTPGENGKHFWRVAGQLITQHCERAPILALIPESAQRAMEEREEAVEAEVGRRINIAFPPVPGGYVPATAIAQAQVEEAEWWIRFVQERCLGTMYGAYQQATERLAVLHAAAQPQVSEPAPPSQNEKRSQ
jgi:hypothetical protein